MPSSSASGPIGPASFTVAYGSVWVGYGDGRIVRVDPRTRRVQTVVRPLITGFVASMASGFGSVWAARHDGTVVRIDGHSGRVEKTFFERWYPGEVAVGRGFIWVGDGDRHVYRLDPRTNRITGRVRVPGRLWGLAAGPAGVWFVTAPARGPLTGPAGPRTLWRLELRTLRASRVMRLTCDTRLSVTREVWALDTCTGSVFRPRGSPIKTGKPGDAIARGSGAVWVVADPGVHRLDPDKRKVVARIRVDGTFLATSAGAVWVLDMGDGVVGWLRRVDPGTNQVVGRAIRLSAR